MDYACLNLGVEQGGDGPPAVRAGEGAVVGKQIRELVDHLEQFPSVVRVPQTRLSRSVGRDHSDAALQRQAEDAGVGKACIEHGYRKLTASVSKEGEVELCEFFQKARYRWSEQSTSWQFGSSLSTLAPRPAQRSSSSMASLRAGWMEQAGIICGYFSASPRT